MKIKQYIPRKKKGENKRKSDQREITTKDNPTGCEFVFKISCQHIIQLKSLEVKTWFSWIKVYQKKNSFLMSFKKGY